MDSIPNDAFGRHAHQGPMPGPDMGLPPKLAELSNEFARKKQESRRAAALKAAETRRTRQAAWWSERRRDLWVFLTGEELNDDFQPFQYGKEKSATVHEAINAAIAFIGAEMGRARELAAEGLRPIEVIVIKRNGRILAVVQKSATGRIAATHVEH